MIGLILVAALASEQPAATPSAPDAYQVGVDTLPSVVARLGKPLSVIHNSDGTTMALYATTRTRVKGASFVPIVGLFAGGAKGQVTSKTFVFDDKGLLKSYSSSETNADCSTAIIGANCH